MPDEDEFPVPRQIIGPYGNLFLMKVHGTPEWVEDAHISDGDWVVVREQQDAEYGEVVVAMIDGERVLTTYELLDPGQGIILGKVVCVLHRI